MLFSLGPVVRYELITTARRGRFYLVRVVYGLFLLATLYTLFVNWEAGHPAGGTIPEVHHFAEDAFIRFAYVQGLALLCVIPALVAGVIADEHQRKTLHYLLASRLSSAEIVLGKLGARLVHVGSFVALGLPVVSLLLLYGGINPTNVFYVYLGTFTLVLFTAGFSILISVLARRPREAILAAYGLEAFWLIIPVAIKDVARDMAWPLGWVETANEWLLRIGPHRAWMHLTIAVYDRRLGTWVPGWNINGFEESFYWMAGLQGAFGVLFLVLAVAGLRPLRGSSWPGARPQTGWWTRLQARCEALGRSRAAAALARNELLATRTVRAHCGERPMLWKELHTRLGGGLKWLGSRPVALFFSVLLGCYLLDVAFPVAEDLLSGRWNGSSWSEMNGALRFWSVVLALLAMFPVAAAAATSITGEREADTWVSLATTLLTPGEIIRAKEIGALWSARWLGLALVLLLGTGLLLGAVHPLGVLAAAAIIGTTCWLAASVGVFFSTRAKNSTRALIFTCLALFLGANTWPPILWASLVSYKDTAAAYSHSSGVIEPAPPFFLYTLGAGWILMLYGAIALLLTCLAIGRLRKTWGQL
jgi:ABC-type transport system involved in multi-copper enzyme maturation permease subunit